MSNIPSLEQMLKLYTKKDLWERIQEKQTTIQTLNARVNELEHRLSNCIEPKFKIGDKVWTYSNGKVFETEIESLTIEIEEGLIDFEYYDVDGICYVDLFATEEEAIAKLRSLKDDSL